MTTVALAVLALTVVSCSDATEDERGGEDGATNTIDEVDAASGEELEGSQSGTTTTDEADVPAPDQEADEEAGQQDGDPEPDQTNPERGDDDGDDDDPESNRGDAEEIDPFEELEWALTPAGPGSPSVNEDPIYKVLDDLDPQRCQALLDDDSWFEPSSFGTGERSVHLFRAGALLCTGDAAAAETAYRRALDFEWPFAVEQPLHSRVCNVWDAVTRMVDPEAGPCALEELPVDDTTEAEDEEAPDEPSSEAEGDEPNETDEPSDTAEPPVTDEPNDTDVPPVTDDPTDASSDHDGGP